MTDMTIEDDFVEVSDEEYGDLRSSGKILGASQSALMANVLPEVGLPRQIMAIPAAVIPLEVAAVIAGVVAGDVIGQVIDNIIDRKFPEPPPEKRPPEEDESR